MVKKMFKNMAAQGDLLIRRIHQLPPNVVPERATDGAYVLAHSETGHNHVVLERPGVTLHKDPVDQFRAFLTVTGDPVELEHLRSYDTHETILVTEGVYEVRRQREYTPESFRKAQD